MNNVDNTGRSTILRKPVWYININIHPFFPLACSTCIRWMCSRLWAQLYVCRFSSTPHVCCCIPFANKTDPTWLSSVSVWLPPCNVINPFSCHHLITLFELRQQHHCKWLITFSKSSCRMKAMVEIPRRPTMQEIQARRNSSITENRLNKRLGMSLPNLGDDRPISFPRHTVLSRIIIPDLGEINTCTA